MGCLISRINSSGWRSPPLARTISESDISSYEAACRAEPNLQKFDVKVRLQTSRTIKSIAGGLDEPSLSLDGLSRVMECLVEMNQEVSRNILQNEKDVRENQELSDLVVDYFKNSLLTLQFCTALDSCLTRAAHLASTICAALRKFQEEHDSAPEEGCVKNYRKTLEELRNLQTLGDPFTTDFFNLFHLVYSQQNLMLQRLHAKKRKLDKKLRRLKAWRRVSNVIFAVTFASVLIFSVVAAAVTAPPLVMALAAAATVPLGSMGGWLNSMWAKYESELRGQIDKIKLTQMGIVLMDLSVIKNLVERFQIKIEEVLGNAQFAVMEEAALVAAVEDIKTKVDGFSETVHDLRERGNRCRQETMMARTLISWMIINHKS